MKSKQTIGIIRRNNKILLGLKKRGWGAGRWNGFGGKVGLRETIDKAMRREVLEETGVIAEKALKIGKINFHFEDKPLQPEVHIYEIMDWQGEPVESEEMKPKWFNLEQIPYREMWPADKAWLPIFLSKKKFTGDIYFKDDNSDRDIRLKVDEAGMTIKKMTLAWIVKDGKILLGRMKRGIAAGKYNGFGGKAEPGETIKETMTREFREETGIEVLKSEKLAVLRFIYLEPNVVMETHIYRVLEYSGEPEETAETLPTWFEFDKIPFDQMWPDDKYWMPYFLANKKFTSYFIFKNYQEIIHFNIDERNRT